MALPLRSGLAPSPQPSPQWGEGDREPHDLHSLSPRGEGQGEITASINCLPLSVERLRLSAFRSYPTFELKVDERPVVLTGENGAGKTNILEALSLMGPGRGLRGVKIAQMGHRKVGEAAAGVPFAIACRAGSGGDVADLGTGQLDTMSERRQARIDGTDATLGALSERVRLVWLTPAMDRLFVEGPAERRRFLDRLTLARMPAHAPHAAAYERAMRERNRLLRDGPRDPQWLSALEREMAHHGAAIATARLRTVEALEGALETQGAFPRALLTLEGTLETLLAQGHLEDEVEARFAQMLAPARPRDEAAGRTLDGPHTSDLAVTHGETGRAAAHCSTGEQKALLVGLILAQTRLVREESGHAGPLLLLDEIAAHLDARRRAALFDEILTLRVQAWMTGTDASAFASLGARAQHFAVAGGIFSPQ